MIYAKQVSSRRGRTRGGNPVAEDGCAVEADLRLEDLISPPPHTGRPLLQTPDTVVDRYWVDSSHEHTAILTERLDGSYNVLMKMRHRGLP